MPLLISKAIAYFATFSWSTVSAGLSIAGVLAWLKARAVVLGAIVAAFAIGAIVLMWHDSNVRDAAVAERDAEWKIKLAAQEKTLREKYEKQNRFNVDVLQSNLTAIAEKAEAASKLNEDLTAQLRQRPSVVCWPAAVVKRKYGGNK